MKLAVLAFVLAAAAAACGGSQKKAPENLTEDVPQEVTCCLATGDDGMDQREVKPVEKCAEESRAPVEDCNVGPGDAEPSE